MWYYGILVGLFMLGLGVFYTRKALISMRNASQLQQNGVVVQGHITERRYYSRAGEYDVTYNYAYEGQTYSREQPVSGKSYPDWNDGTAISVSCLPSNPAVATIVGESYASRATRRSLIYGIVFIFMGIVGGLGIVYTNTCHC